MTITGETAVSYIAIAKPLGTETKPLARNRKGRIASIDVLGRNPNAPKNSSKAIIDRLSLKRSREMATTSE